MAVHYKSEPNIGLWESEPQFSLARQNCYTFLQMSLTQSALWAYKRCWIWAPLHRKKEGVPKKALHAASQIEVKPQGETLLSQFVAHSHFYSFCSVTRQVFLPWIPKPTYYCPIAVFKKPISPDSHLKTNLTCKCSSASAVFILTVKRSCYIAWHQACYQP